MAKKDPKWQKANPHRGDVKNILTNTKKLADMYLTILKQKKEIWEVSLDEQKEKEKRDGTAD